MGDGFGLPLQPTVFEVDYRCYPVTFHDKAELEKGDKIVMPPSALDRLARMNVSYPMLFELKNISANRGTHCGVMEFSAPEGVCYLPYWMMQGLLLSEGSIVHVKNVTLKKASFVKFQPRSKDFLEITNPKAVLEKALRTFSCMTIGDQICFPYNDKKYYMDVLEVKPDGKACVIETDCKVDFAPPVGYVEPDWKGQAAAAAAANSTNSASGKLINPSEKSSLDQNTLGTAKPPVPPMTKKTKKKEKAPRSAHLPPEPENPIKAFSGFGTRLDGKPKKNNPNEKVNTETETEVAAKLASQRRQLALAAAARRERNAKKRKKHATRMAVEVKGQGSKLAFGGIGRTLQ